jgi:hypothetical protein
MILAKFVAISLLMATFAVGCTEGRAVGQPDFTGTWKLDRDLSSPVSAFDDLILIISQASVELHVKRVIKRNKRKDQVSEVTFYTDGRGEETPLLLSKEKWKSTTNWASGTLVRKFRVTGFTLGDVYYQDHTETWSLSADGKTLTVDTETKPGHVPALFRNVMKPGSYHRVFQRVA